jgi:hypothetical protein
MYKWSDRKFNIPYNKADLLKNISNKNRNSTFALGESKYLFDLYDFEAIPMKDNLCTSFENNTHLEINQELKKELISKNIII